MSSPSSTLAPKHANRGKNMAALIEEEGLDEDGQQKKQSNPRHPRKRKRKQTKKTPNTSDDDDKDSDFLTSSAGDESASESGSDGPEGAIPNEEIADMLPSKTAPSTKRTKTATHTQHHKSKKSRKATVEEVEDDEGPQKISTRNQAASRDPPAATEVTTSNAEQKKKRVKRSNPTCFGLLVTFFAYLDLLWRLSEFFREGVTQSRCGGQVFGLRLLKYSCLLKKNFILCVLSPQLHCVNDCTKFKIQFYFR